MPDLARSDSCRKKVCFAPDLKVLWLGEDGIIHGLYRGSIRGI